MGGKELMNQKNAFRMYGTVDEKAITGICEKLEENQPNFRKYIQWYPHITLFQNIIMKDGYSDDLFYVILEQCCMKSRYYIYSTEGIFTLKTWSRN